MNRIQFYTLAGVLLASCALVSCAAAPVTADPTASPPAAEQIVAAKKAQAQARFEAACKYGGGVWQVAKPIAVAKAVTLGDEATLAVKALDIFVTTTCNGTIDVNKADTIIQNGYDTAGKVAVLVIAALTS